MRSVDTRGASGPKTELMTLPHSGHDVGDAEGRNSHGLVYKLFLKRFWLSFKAINYYEMRRKNDVCLL